MTRSAGALLAIVLAACTVHAQDGSSLDAQIGARTRVIESPHSTRDQQLDAQAARGVLFRKAGRFDLAIVDLTEVLRSRPQADDVLVERGMALKATQQHRGLKINFREIFWVVRFSTFATISAITGHSHCIKKAATRSTRRR